MNRIAFFSVLLLIQSLTAGSQTPEDGVHQADDNKLYINKDLGIYLWLSTSPEENSKKVRLHSDSSSKYSNPMYLDTEGYNTLRSPSAVDTATRKPIYPLQDIIFELYADGLAPVTKARFLKSEKKVVDGKTYYSSSLNIELSSRDAVSGLYKLEYSLNSTAFAEYKTALTSFKEGENVLKFHASDKVGNKEDTHEIIFYVDNTPPKTNYEVLGNTNEKYVSVNATIQLTSEDALSGVKAIYYQINQNPPKKYVTPIPVKVLADDKSVISYYAVDNLGNKENSQKIGGDEGMQVEGEENKLNYEFYVDSDPPEVKLEVMDNSYKGKYNYVSTNTKFKITADDLKSGVNTIHYSINTSAIDQEYKDPFTLDKKGLHYIRVQATDYVGNASNAALQAYYCDPDPPVSKIAVSTPKYESRDTLFISSKTSIRLSATDETAGLKSISYRVDNKGKQEYQQAFIIEESGLHTIHYSASDQVNNTEEDKTLQVYVDNDGPKVHYHFSVESIGSKQVRDEAYTIYPTNAMIYIAATDARSGGERIEYTINGGSVKMDNPIKGLSPNNYQITIKAIDVLGNTSTQDVKFAIEE